MATPMTAKHFTDLLDKWNIKWKFIHGDWATHNRNSKGEWGPVNGVVLHHTGDDSQNPEILYRGRIDLPGPLCHAGIDKDGVLHLAGWGRANHAGLGDSNVLKHVVAEDYTGILKPTKADIDGNSHFYGFEIMYSGSHSMSEAQHLTSVRLSAAICTWHGWTEKSVIGHGEWQPGKWDPGYTKGKMMPMDTYRNWIKQAKEEGPVQKKPTPPTEPTRYVVKKGDTLYSIAKSTGLSIGDLVTLNPSIIHMPIGTKLNIRKK